MFNFLPTAFRDLPCLCCPQMAVQQVQDIAHELCFDDSVPINTAGAQAVGDVCGVSGPAACTCVAGWKVSVRPPASQLHLLVLYRAN